MFGKKLRELREHKGLSQEELGKVLNKTKNNISQYETGKREPDLDTLNKIADFFNVSVDYLLGRTENPTGMLLTNRELNKYLPDEAKQRKIKVEIEKKPNLTEDELQYVADLVLKKLAEHYVNIDKNK